MHDYRRLSSELKEAVRMEDEYINELQMLDSYEEVLKGVASSWLNNRRFALATKLTLLSFHVYISVNGHTLLSIVAYYKRSSDVF
ncbi:hypothetical protein Tco_0123415 [Tanacetum coccineum]